MNDNNLPYIIVCEYGNKDRYTFSLEVLGDAQELAMTIIDAINERDYITIERTGTFDVPITNLISVSLFIKGTDIDDETWLIQHGYLKAKG